MKSIRDVGRATAGTLLGNGLSLILPFAVTAWFGTGPETDAYFYALGAILFMNVIISVAVEAATTPTVMPFVRGHPQRVQQLVRRTQVQAAVACAAVTGLGILLVQVLLLGHTSFSPSQETQVLHLLVLLSPIPALVTWNGVLAGAFYAYKMFGLPTSSVALRTVVALVLGFTLRDQVGISAVALGLMVGEVMRLALLEHRWLRLQTPVEGVPAAGTSSSSAHIPTGRSLWKSAGPQVLAMSLSGVSPLVDKTVAISVGVGAVTTLELAQRLVYTPILLLMSGVGLVLGSRWAESLTRNEWVAVRREYRSARYAVLAAGVVVVLVALPAAFLLRPWGRDFLGIADATLLALTFTAAAIGIPFALASQVSVRLLLAARRTGAMPFLTVGVLIVNLVLDLVLVRLLGLPGIALSSALVNVFNFVAYGLVVRHVLSSAPTRGGHPSEADGHQLHSTGRDS